MSKTQDVIQFLQAAAENERDILAQAPQLVAYLEEVHHLFQGLAGKHLSGDPLCGLFLMNAHASFLSAARIALSGQSPPAFLVLRGCIESALYALIAKSDESTKTVWLERERDRRQCRNTFTAQKGLAVLRTVDPKLAIYVNDCYEASIDFGAHPNMRSILDHMIVEDDSPADLRVSLVYLGGVGSMPVMRTLIACVETGLTALMVSAHVLPNHKPAVEAHNRAHEVSVRLRAWLQQEGILADDDSA